MATLQDAIYGLAVGDALGVPFEFCQRDMFSCQDMVAGGKHNQLAGTWSDDTSMTLATCDSLRVNHGRINVKDMRERFCAWLNDGAYTCDGKSFDVGGTTLRALRSGSGESGERDNGNGSLMRILPLAFVDATDDEVRAVSAITHAHETSCEACVRYVQIARALRSGTPPAEAIPNAKEIAATPRFEISSGGYVLDTYTAALWALLTTKSFERCVIEAVNLGRDTDTTAAVAGGLAGIVYGYSGIPKSWRQTLRGRDVIDATLF